MDNVYASPVLLGDIWKHKYEELVVVSPDVGGVVRARAIAKRLDESDLAIIDKRRPKANEAEVVNIIGDVQNPLVSIWWTILLIRRNIMRRFKGAERKGRAKSCSILHSRSAVWESAG